MTALLAPFQHSQPVAVARRSDTAALVPLAAGLIAIVHVPSLYGHQWTPKYVAALGLGAIGLPILAGVARRDAGARLGALFVVAAAASAMTAGLSTTSIWGMYGHSGGLLFVAALSGAWAIGRVTSDRAREWLQVALVVGAVVNAVVAVAQTWVPLDALDLALYGGSRASGLLGNPVHLGAMAAAAAVLVGVRARRSSYRALTVSVVAVTLFGAAVQLSGSRVALVLAGGGLLTSLARRPLRGLLLVVALAAGCGAAGLAPTPEGVAASERLAASPASGLEIRVANWETAGRALAERPILGSGPGTYRTATSTYRTAELAAHEGADRMYHDAHNLVVEYAVTTGVFGALALLAFVLWSLARGRGPLRGFAVALLAVHLLEPQYAGTTPLLFLALGAALPASVPPARPVKAMAGILVAGWAAVAASLLAGDFYLERARLDFRPADAARADELLPAWPEPAEMRSRLALYHGATRRDADLRADAVTHMRSAVGRDPQSSYWWIRLGELELASPGFEEHARARFEEALRWDPASARAQLGLARSALAAGADGEARQHLAAAIRMRRDLCHDRAIARLAERLDSAARSTDERALCR